MTPGEPITIRAVSNGFTVSPIAGRDEYIAFEAFAVFNSMTDLAEWLAKHFEVKHD